MRNAFLLRLSPRYSRSGRLRGTLIDPAAAATSDWGSDQLDYYRTTVQAGIAPAEPVTVEFGQPPVELSNGGTAAIGADSLMFLVMGAESSQGSSNDRGLLGVGRIRHITRTNNATGASARIAVELTDVVLSLPVVKTSTILASRFLPLSGLRAQKIFGWDGSPSAQNCVPLHNRAGDTDEEVFAPVLATLALMRDENPNFWADFTRLYPDLASEASTVTAPPTAVAIPDQYTPPEYRSDPIDSTSVMRYLNAKGLTFDPWQVAAYLTAVRTKPFVILAGMSGTGKTSLPRFVAEGTGAELEIASVRPDWTDSTDLLGYSNISGDFVPGRLSRFAASAMANPEVQHFFVLDEMNIARTEYYLAEVLSCIERRDPEGSSAPLTPHAGVHNGIDYGEVVIPRNLALIGSVNVDETTFDFSKKVLDRAFVLEFSNIDLRSQNKAAADAASSRKYYGSSSWRSAKSLDEDPTADPTIGELALNDLIAINDILADSRLDIGYRVRDEFVSFVIESAFVGDGFSTTRGDVVQPVDVAISTKLLPRIQGAGLRIDSTLSALREKLREMDCPISAGYVEKMIQRLKNDGFTSFF